ALRFTGYACPLWLQFEEPELNLVRAALAALACALGGAQAMPHPGYDEAYAIPTEKSQSLALGTQQILAEETNITKAVDPLGGSNYMEYLTNQLEQKIAQKMKEIEDYGGPMKAINDGYMQRDILDYFYRDQEAVRTGQRVVVRHNKYRLEGEEEPGKKLTLHQPNPEAVERHITRLRRVRAERDSSRVQACLKRLQGAAAGKENVMPYLIEAATACATLGEMTGALKEVFGQFKEPIVV
ncbi:MAG: methylmalonyl-CoA mutase family protein, partial [Chloroflexota bacterium]|nr:methylmalonyl-CoA mutase family protein [Chloroflexota bacterium]